MAAVWEVLREAVPSGLRLRLFEAGRPLAFDGLIDRFERDVDFADWYSAMLLAQPGDAWFWEHPPLTDRTLDAPAELVLIGSASLAGLAADASAFADAFARAPEDAVVCFPNLGGDAELVVPRPLTADAAYAHLAAFLRTAPPAQVRALWRATGRALREVLGPAPRWLSTSGLGVPWLHLRLDTRPKYYQHRAYAAFSAARG